MDPEIPAFPAVPKAEAPKQPEPTIEEFRRLQSEVAALRADLTKLQDAVRKDLSKLIRKPSEF